LTTRGIATALEQREPLHIPDLRQVPHPLSTIALRAGFNALLAAPLVRPGQVVGLLIVRRREPGWLPKGTVDLVKTFAAQSVLAIQNARLFSELDDKSRQLEI